MTYDGFKEDIAKCFKELIEDYNLTLEDNPKEKGWYKLTNSKCTLFFSFDRGEINCAIKSRKIDTEDLSKLFKLATPTAPLPVSENPWSGTNQLNNYVFMIMNSYLKNTLKGDNSWYKNNMSFSFFSRLLKRNIRKI
jgi:hypothetical protein